MVGKLGLPLGGMREETCLGKGRWELSGGKVVSYILIGVWVTHVYTFGYTYW